MKTIITTLLLLVSACAVKAQAYIPFPVSNAMWTERHGNGDTTPSYFCYGLINEDTTLNIVTYHKLFKSVDSVFTASECIGGLREDSMKRIFYYDFATAHEHMLYDFSVQPGDTVDSDPGSAGIVYSIDSININGNYHKRINFETYNGNFWTYGSWIEGIGNSSLGGLLGSAMLQPTCDCASNLICFKQNNVWQYHNPLYISNTCINDALAVENITTAQASVSIYPNPLTGAGTIHVEGITSAAGINIYSITGTLLHTYQVTNNTNITINSNQYPAGIYYYRLINSTGNTTGGKFVIE